MSQDKARDPYFDNLKGILIILVCAGHCLNIYRDSNPYCNYLFHLIYAFHMPLFFFISGYFSKNVEKVYKCAFETLIIPTIPFELLYYIMHIATKADNTEPFLTPIFAYWFCFVLFFCRLLLPFLIKIRGVVYVSIALALVAGFNPHIDEFMSLSRMLCMLPFFLAGYFTTKETMSRIRGINRSLAIVAGLAAAAAIFAILHFTDSDLGFTLRSPYGSTEGILFRGAQFILSVPLSLMIMKLTPLKELYLSVIGQRTLQIYFLHFYVTTLIKMFNPLNDGGIINFVVMIVIAPAIAWILACKPVSKVYDAMVDATGRLIIK